MNLDKRPNREAYLDEALEESFPASDPISVSHAYDHAPKAPPAKTAETSDADQASEKPEPKAET